MNPSAPSPVSACLRCGNCCRHPGEVRLENGEADTIATALRLDVHAFTSRYTRLREDRRGLSLLDNPDGSCVFLSPAGWSPSTTSHQPSFPPRAASCRIHSAKPRQCREFPVSWQYDNLAAICMAARSPITDYRSPITDCCSRSHSP